MLVWGGLDTSQNPKIMKMMVLGLSIMKSGFYYTKMKEINSRKLLKVLSKYIVTINGPKIDHNYYNNGSYDFPVVFPMILHCELFNNFL